MSEAPATLDRYLDIGQELAAKSRDSDGIYRGVIRCTNRPTAESHGPDGEAQELGRYVGAGNVPLVFGGVKGVLAPFVASRRSLTPPLARGARHLSPES